MLERTSEVGKMKIVCTSGLLTFRKEGPTKDGKGKWQLWDVGGCSFFTRGTEATLDGLRDEYAEVELEYSGDAWRYANKARKLTPLEAAEAREAEKGEDRVRLYTKCLEDAHAIGEAYHTAHGTQYLEGDALTRIATTFYLEARRKQPARR